MEDYIPPLQKGGKKISVNGVQTAKEAMVEQLLRLEQLAWEQAQEELKKKEKEEYNLYDKGMSLYSDLREKLPWIEDGQNQGILSAGENSGKFTNAENSAGRLNTSFSGVDTKLSITFDGGKPIYVGEVQTITYSLFRPIEPVYSLGDAKPTGFVRGQRTIAGSIIFTVFDRNVLLNAFYNAYASYGNRKCVDQDYLTDELPPFDMHITFMNEYGVSAALVIYGAYIPTEGQVHSIEDMITENTVQYVAQDMRLMRPGDIT